MLGKGRKIPFQMILFAGRLFAIHRAKAKAEFAGGVMDV
jgi:hypothetical protein